MDGDSPAPRLVRPPKANKDARIAEILAASEARLEKLRTGRGGEELKPDAASAAMAANLLPGSTGSGQASARPSQAAGGGASARPSQAGEDLVVEDVAEDVDAALEDFDAALAASLSRSSASVPPVVSASRSSAARLGASPYAGAGLPE